MVTGVEFDEDKISYGGMRSSPRAAGGQAGSAAPYRQYSGRVGGMPGWLMEHGWAKTEKAAQGILIAVVIVNIIITYIVIKYFL